MPAAGEFHRRGIGIGAAQDRREGAGAAGPGMAAITIVQDLFDGAVARAKMSYLVFAVNIVPMIAPTVGAALLVLGGWPVIYLVPVAAGIVSLLASQGIPESAPIDPGTRLRPAYVLASQTIDRPLAEELNFSRSLFSARIPGRDGEALHELRRGG